MIYVVSWKNKDSEQREVFDEEQSALDFYYLVRSFSDNHTVSFAPYGEK